MTHSERTPVRKNTEAAVETSPTAEFTGPRYFNRELSWLEFNRRVLDKAMDESVPLLERLKFLAIFSTNLDEFFMIRVSGLKEQVEEGVRELSPDGLTPAEQMAEIEKRLRPMLKRQSSYLSETVIPKLSAAGITVEPYDSLNAKDKKRLDKYFRENLFPILTPQSVDSSHPFPYISNLSLNIGLMIEPNRHYTQKNLKHLFRQKRFARIKLPPSVPRLIPISEKHGRFTLIEEVVAANAKTLFPNMRTGPGFLFRVTRDADIEIREEEAGDLLRTLESELQRRRFRFAVRLEVSVNMPNKMLKMLATGIGVTERDIYQVNGFMNIPDLVQLCQLDRPELSYKPIPIVHPTALAGKKSIFDALKKQDVLVHHPYISFSAVTDLIAEAANDRDVQAIKICLYRTGKDSPVVRSLIKASQKGKQVTALVELKARFDEEKNIEWAKRLENEGVHVVYGINSLKTHSKVLLIVRREKDKLARYVHIATGNYNPLTARHYTDIGLLTADDAISSDATSLFNFLTGYSQQDDYTRMVVAPLSLREKLLKLIGREIANKKKGKDARIIIKTNSITDIQLIDKLYEAGAAGVQVDLIVRGICSLRPGIKGFSENIKVRSIIGRYLEHSRVYFFANGDADANSELFISSADWMQRNLDRRVEVALPIADPEIKHYLRHSLLELYLKDNVNASILKPDGTYRKASAGNARPVDSQMDFVGKQIGD
ncbi:MAG: polyphosphate kinase 1 [Pyrinomonadaceae bacterium]